MYNTTDREYYERNALSTYLTEGNSPLIDRIHRTLTAFKGKMFKVDGYHTKAFEKALEPLNLRSPIDPNNHFIGGLTVKIFSIQIRTSYSSLELNIRCMSNVDGEHGTQYNDITLNLARFEAVGMGYDYSTHSELRSLFSLRESLNSYNPIDLDTIHARQTEHAELKRQLKELENTMPYYSYR